MSLITPELTARDTLDVVSFMACGSCFAIEAKQVRALLTTGETDLPSYSFANLVGLSDEETLGSASDSILVVKLAKGDCAVSVSEPVELRSLPIGAIYPLPFFIAQCCQLKGLCGLALTQEGLTLLMDLRAILIPTKL